MEKTPEKNQMSSVTWSYFKKGCTQKATCQCHDGWQAKLMCSLFLWGAAALKFPKYEEI